MLTITSLDKQTTLPLIETGQPERFRDIDGTHTLHLVVRETDINSRAFKLIENEATLTLKGDKYIIKDIKPSVVGESVQFEIEAVHKFSHDLAGNWIHDIIKGRKVLSLHQALTHLLPDDYTFIIHDDFDNKSYEDFGNESSLALFERIRVDYNFEYIKDDTYIKIYKQIGNKTSKQMRYKHNIVTINGGLNSTNLATHIEGVGKPVQDAEGNPIEGEYVVSATYTSPLADVYGILEAQPVNDERFTDESALLDYMKSKLHDTIDISYDITYDEFVKALDDAADVELGDSIYLIHEKLNENFNTRIVSITDYPLSDNLRPIYTISSKKESLVDRQVQANTEKKNNDKELAILGSKTNELDKALAKVDRTMIEVDKELERIDNEVIPGVNQAIENTKIPQQVDPPSPTPSSNLWWDTSVNPPAFKRYKNGQWEAAVSTGSLNINDIFANQAVIAKIQSDSVLTANLDASKITAGTLDAGKVSVVNLSANSIISGEIDAKKINIKNINADNINAGTISPKRIMVTGETQFADGYDPTKIEIGGRNLIPKTLPNTKNLSGWVAVGDYTNLRIDEVDGFEYFRLGITSDVETGYNPRMRGRYVTNLIHGKTYTASWKAIHSNYVSSEPYGGIYDNNGIIRQSFTNRAERREVRKVMYQGYLRTEYEYFYTFTFDYELANEKKFTMYLGATYTREDPLAAYILFKDVILEEGNKKTPWSQAPEDMQAEIEDAKDEFNESINNVIAEYTAAIDFESDEISIWVQEMVENQDEQIRSFVESEIAATKDDFTISFSQIEESLGEHDDTLNELTSYFHFSESGLNIGKTDSPLHINISNEQMDFMDGENQVAYINGTKMYIDQLDVISSMVVGVHQIEKYNNDITLVRWVGED